jgi:hypothetical protein
MRRFACLQDCLLTLTCHLAIGTDTCKVTRLQFMINAHILLGNRCVLQQQSVDCKITYTLLKRGTKEYVEGWDVVRKTWVHMVLHLPSDEVGFGITFNDVTKNVVFYTTISRFVVWRMICGTRPHGHHSLFFSSVISTPIFLLCLQC